MWSEGLECPVGDCSFKARNESQLIHHCSRRHEVTNILRNNYQHCKLCHVLRKKSSNWSQHHKSKTCITAAERRNIIIDRMVMEETVGQGLRLKYRYLRKVHSCKYLGRVITDDRNNFLALKNNLRKAQI